MKKCMLSFLILVSVLSSVAQDNMTWKEFYGTWVLHSVNSLVLNPSSERQTPATYFDFKEKKLYTYYQGGVTDKGTLEILVSALGKNTLVLTAENGEKQNLPMVFEKKNGESFLMLTTELKDDEDAMEFVMTFIKIKENELAAFRRKAEQEKKIALAEQSKKERN